MRQSIRVSMASLRASKRGGKEQEEHEGLPPQYSGGEDHSIELIWDPLLGCYYDPASNTYYDVEDEALRQSEASYHNYTSDDY